MVSYANGENVWERVIRMVEIMQSIRPKWCYEIISGAKDIEARKTRPKCGTPFKVDIYCTKAKPSDVGKIPDVDCWSGKAIGEYVCDEIYTYQYLKEKGEYDRSYWFPDHKSKSCLSEEDLLTYGNGKTLYGWHISDLKIYDKPKDIREFKRVNRTEENTPCAHVKWLYEPCEKCKECNLTRAPQSWCYVQRIWE